MERDLKLINFYNVALYMYNINIHIHIHVCYSLLYVYHEFCYFLLKAITKLEGKEFISS